MSGPTDNERLPRQAEQAVAALLAERTIEAAAQRVGVSPSTMRCWLERRAFQELYRRARRDMLEQVVATGQSHACREPARRPARRDERRRA